MTSSAAVMNASPPRFHHRPESRSSAGSEAVDLAAAAGLDLDPWQQLVLEGALAESRPGIWAAREVGLIVPRQNGKGSILEARELFGLFLGGEKLQTHTAHRFDTAQEHFRRMVDLIDGCPDLARKVLRIRHANGDEGIELRSGARLNFKARSKGSGRGFAGVDLIVLDEAFYLHELASLIPSMSANPNTQVWYTSSSPVFGPESDVLRALCARGRAGGLGFYAEWSCEFGANIADRANWWAANPAMDIRLTEQFTEIEFATLSADEFARERLGIWNPDEAKPREIPAADWDACADPSAAPSDPVSIGIEMTGDRMAGAISVCGDWGDFPTVELIDYREGESAAHWMVPRLIELAGRVKPKHLVVDPKGAAGTLIPDLEAAGLVVTRCELKDHIAACAGLFDAVLAHELRHNGDATLAASVAGASKREVAGAWLWRGAPALVASGLAWWGHTQPAAPVVDPVSQVW